MIFKLIKYYFSLIYWSCQSVDKVRKMQLRKFKEIFEYAREHSPFYKDLYTKAGIMDLDIQSWEDVEKVPVVDKDVYRKICLEDRMTCAVDEKKQNIHSTSGSSGNPLKIAYDKWVDYTGHIRVLFMLMKVAHYTPFTKIFMIARYEENDQFTIEKDVSLLSKIQSIFHIFRREIVSIYRSPEYIIQRIEVSKPKILWATPSVVEIVANKLVEQNKKLDIPYLFLTSEGISNSQYDKFVQYISSNVISHYGAMESPSIAYFVNPAKTARVFAESCLVEYIDKTTIGAKKQGTIVVTSLLNKTMPFVRYNLKDYGEILDDVNFPNKVIGPITGRLDDILDFPDGTKFFHHHAYEMFMDFHEVLHYKFIQVGNNPITMQLLVNPKFSQQEAESQARKRWNKRFAQYPLNIEFVDHLEINKKTGKYKNIEKIKNDH